MTQLGTNPGAIVSGSSSSSGGGAPAPTVNATKSVYGFNRGANIYYQRGFTAIGEANGFAAALAVRPRRAAVPAPDRFYVGAVDTVNGWGWMIGRTNIGAPVDGFRFFVTLYDELHAPSTQFVDVRATAAIDRSYLLGFTYAGDGSREFLTYCNGALTQAPAVLGANYGQIWDTAPFCIGASPVGAPALDASDDPFVSFGYWASWAAPPNQDGWADLWRYFRRTGVLQGVDGPSTPEPQFPIGWQVGTPAQGGSPACLMPVFTEGTQALPATWDSCGFDTTLTLTFAGAAGVDTGEFEYDRAPSFSGAV